MRKLAKYVLDIGSSSLRLLAVTHAGGKPYIFAEESILYDGFMDGEFLTPDELSGDLSTLIQRMSDKMGQKIDRLVVGLPSEFCICVCKRISRKFMPIRKLTSKDIDSLYLSNADFGESENYTLINYSPMQFVLDDGVKTMSPVGKKTASLTLDASFILAKRAILEFLSNILTELKIENVDFVSTALGQAIYCSQINDDKTQFAVVDVGHISTSVCILKGEGLALLSSFSMGGGHISSDLMQVLKLSFKDAELIKRKIILTILSERNESYEACSKGDVIKAPINLTNQVVKSRIEVIAKVIGEILSLDEVYKDIKVYITGDGITHFKGVLEIIRQATGLDVCEFKNQFDNSNSKFQTSKSGLAILSDMLV